MVTVIAVPPILPDVTGASAGCQQSAVPAAVNLRLGSANRRWRLHRSWRRLRLSRQYGLLPR
jgi:hypothetical protein